MPSYIGTSIQKKPAYLNRNEKLRKQIHQEKASFIPTIQQAMKLIDEWLRYKHSQPCPNIDGKTIQEVLETITPHNIKEELKYLLGSREMFFQFLNGTFITDIQRAVQFLFLITRSFGGLDETFGTVKKSSGGASKAQRNMLTKIDAINERLDKVLIENIDFEKLIKQYDFEDTFFYCDPPYTYGCGYKVSTTIGFDQERLRDTLKNIKGRCLLSYDNSPKVRELYKGYQMIEIQRLNGINNSEGTRRDKKFFKEVLIANYDILSLFKNE